MKIGKMAQLPLKTLIPSVVIAASALLLGVLAFHAVTRPLWTDEVMAMVNYPLPGVRALFEPLPHYSQAAPPLFNLVSNLLVGLDPAWGRSLLLAVITGGVLATVAAAYGRAAALAAALLGMVVSPAFIPMASEFKYYGFEMLGMGLALAWLLRKDPNTPISFADAVLLGCAVILGISTIAFVPLAMAALLILRWRSSFVLRGREIALLLGLLAFTALYYLGVRHATSVQIATYTDVYQQHGIGAVVHLAMAAVRNIGPFLFPLLLAAALITLIDWRSAASQRLILYVALVGAAFGGLALVGLYPVSVPRHLTWITGIVLFLLANAACRLAEGTFARRDGKQRAPAAAIALCVAIALLAPARVLASRNPFVLAENDKAIAALLARPERQVGLWLTGQPVIEYYEQLYPDLKRRDYFGGVNAASAPLPADLAGAPMMTSSYAQVSAELEQQRNQPGAWGRLAFYRMRLDFSAPAARLVAQAPRGTPFLIFTSHMETDERDPQTRARVDGLLHALDAAHCRHDVAARGTGYFMLDATCP